ELAQLLIPRAEGTGWEVFPADLAEPQASRPDRRLEIGHLEVDHFVPPRLEPTPPGGERIVVPRRGETQNADATHECSFHLGREKGLTSSSARRSSLIPTDSGRQIVTMIFPNCSLDSTKRWASAIFSNGKVFAMIAFNLTSARPLVTKS